MQLILLDRWNIIFFAQEINFNTCETHNLLKIHSQNISFPILAIFENHVCNKLRDQLSLSTIYDDYFSIGNNISLKLLEAYQIYGGP